jgi:tetratricopeptide (TPR) repeat protein
MEVSRIDWIEGRWTALAVFAVALAVYANSVANGFAYDDVSIIAQNARVHQLSDLRAIWLTPYWPIAGEVLGLYRPLAIFSYAVQWALSGGDPWLFHLVNVLLHGGVTVLVLLVLRHLFSTMAAVAGALLFAVHPVHTEAVANVVGQAEVLSAGGVLLACLIYIRADPDQGLTRARLYMIASLYFTAMLVKEGAVVLPGLLVALDLMRRRVELDWRGMARYAREMAVPLALLTATLLAYLFLRLEVLGSIGGSDANPGLPFLREGHRVLSAMRGWTEFARLLIFPMDLSADYSPAVILPAESWTPMTLLGVGLFAVTLIAALLVGRYPAAGGAAWWFLIAILPVSNLLFPIGVLVAERTLYLPSVAVSILAAGLWGGVARAGERRVRVFASVAGVALLVLFSGRTVVRNPEWRDTDAVFEALYRDHPESYRAQLQFAIQALQQGDTAASREYWELAYRLWPRDPALLVQYGFVNITWKDYERAVALLEEAAAIHPGYDEAKPFLAQAYVQTGRHEEAIALVERLFPKLGPGLFLFDIRGRAYAASGNDAEAATSFRAATRQPGGDNWAIWTMLARSLSREGHVEEAEEALRNARMRAEGDSATLTRIEAFLTGMEQLEPTTDSARGLQNAIEAVRP